CEALYRRHALKPYFRILSTAGEELEDALARRGYLLEDPTRTLFMDFATHPLPVPKVPVELDPGGPSAEWLSAYARLNDQSLPERITLEKILRQLTLPAVYGAVRDDFGAICSIAKGAVHDGVVCINMVATDTVERRRGFSRACVSAILN